MPRKVNVKKVPRPPHTGWAPGLLQDDCRELSVWFASKPEARYLVRARAREITQQLEQA